MQHIVLYINSMTPSGGIERVIATLAKNFSTTYRVTVLVKDNPTTFYELPENVAIVSLDYELKLNMDSRISRVLTLGKHLFGVRKRLSQKFKELNPDFFYIISPYACLETIVAKIPKKKVVVTEHGSRSNFNFIYQWMKTVLYKKYPVHIVPTVADCNWYKERGFPSVLIPHFRSNLPYERCELNSKTVLNIGRLTNDKNQLALLRIWDKIMKIETLKDWDLKIVGGGENQELLMNFIADNAIPNVRILSPVSDVERYYKSSSIYVSTSRSEGFPMVLVESVSFGLPTIAFDCPTGPDEILNDNSGVLIPLGDEDEFVYKLTELMSNLDLRIEYSEKAFARSSNWGEEEIMDKWNTIFSI
ncbi:glycosyltransferase [Flavobacterium sp. WC2430]|uniref:glycosyltransferase n=1 Tax=Flavobacterium sp. WC2430 TaxID=3234137 RepID=UPI003466E9F2